jgi:alpha-1,3-rhamnosyl/mannosyltransferase
MSLQIGVDAWNLPGDRRGIGRYVREILRRWIAWGPSRVRVTLIVPERLTLLAAQRYVRALDAGRVAVRSRASVARLALDSLWFPWNGMSWSATGHKVATLHDASRFALPPSDAEERAREQQTFLRAAREADRIITDSHFSKTELVRYLGIEPDKIVVVHLGVGDRLPTIVSPVAGIDGASRYLLFVGENEPRKGLDTLLEAMPMLPAGILQGTAVVVAGEPAGQIPSTWSSELDVRVLGHVSDERLSKLYGGAAALVYPSRYEGFGLPVLEAMAAGTPVIASNAAGIPEAGGDAALYFSSGDAAQLAAAISRVLSDERLARELQAKGRERAAAMTWDQTAEGTYAVFRQGSPAG